MNYSEVEVGTAWLAAMGDFSLLGWITSMAYFLAAFLCLRAAASYQFISGAKGHYAYWILLALVLVFLGLNKQLDFQTLMIIAGRKLAVSQGWYEQRRLVQAIFGAAFILCCLLALGVLLWLTRGTRRRRRLDLWGLGLLAAYLASRAATIDHLDQHLGINLGNLFPLELAGIFCAGFAAFKAGPGKTSKPPANSRPPARPEVTDELNNE